MWRGNRLLPYMVVMPAILLFIIFILFPTLGNLYFSFTNYNGDMEHTNWVGLQNYRFSFGNDLANVVSTLKVTVVFCILVTVVQNATAVGLATLVNLKIKFRNVYRAAIFLPNILGVVVVGMIWTLIFDPVSGPVNHVLGWFGSQGSALLGDPKIAIYLVVFVQIWMTVGYAMILYIAGLQDIPQDLYEAGQMDGATGWSAFVQITIPMLWPVITVNLMLSLIGSLKVYDTIMVLTNGGPGTSTMTIGMYIFRNLFGSTYTQGYAAALSFIHFAIILLVVVVFYKLLMNRGRGYGWDE